MIPGNTYRAKIKEKTVNKALLSGKFPPENYSVLSMLGNGHSVEVGLRWCKRDLEYFCALSHIHLLRAAGAGEKSSDTISSWCEQAGSEDQRKRSCKGKQVLGVGIWTAMH